MIVTGIWAESRRWAIYSCPCYPPTQTPIGTDLENTPPQEKAVERVTAYGVSVDDTEPGQAAKEAQTDPKFEWRKVSNVGVNWLWLRRYEGMDIE